MLLAVRIRMKHEVTKGRGATLQIEGRFENVVRERFDDGWSMADQELPAFRTTVTVETAKRVIQRNDSPDLPFEQSLNAYRGCEHGCIYCYARPSHAWLNLSPGLDFETRLFAKPDAARLLRSELARRSYQCKPIALGSNTDPYQPIEREWTITRDILQVLADCRHPLSIVTKSAMIERDINLLVQLARDNLVQVFISVTTLDPMLARKLEPRAASPARRLLAMRRLNEAGVPCAVLVAPVIPFLTDAELESVLQAAHEHGASMADYTLLRLPYELKALFKDWLDTHYPLKAAHVMSRLRGMRGGKENESEFGSRFSGDGLFAQLLSKRFQLACERLGFCTDSAALDTSKFIRPEPNGQQNLFEK
jgi:DNA repair photolyase